MTMSLLQRARDSGKCPPSLLSEDGVVEGDGFEDEVLKTLDVDGGFFLAPDVQIADTFSSILQKAKSSENIPASTDDLKKAALEQRRCILLAIVGATPSSSPSLERVLSDGYLSSVKSWLDDILAGSVGSVDLLLHLLSNIIELPVTKTVVKNSGMGKAIGSIEKHSICKGTPNESAIKSRVQQIKDAWNASVKARKGQDQSAETKSSKKRDIDSTVAVSPTSPKRVKVAEEAKKSPSFSSLLKKISASATKVETVSAAAQDTNPTPMDSSESEKAASDTIVSEVANVKGEPSAKQGGNEAEATTQKKLAMRVKWADHFGGSLADSHAVEGEERDHGLSTDSNVSWSDRKKRDRMREKELLAKAKKAKLLDEDDEDLDLPKPVQPTVPWHEPSKLPDHPDVTKAKLDSPEISVQNDRMKAVQRSSYVSEYEVPSSPAPLSDVEQALDMTSQSSAVVATIPFFVPQQPAPAPAPEDTSTYQQSNAQAQQSVAASSMASSAGSPATPELVQALGLPMFLVGQDSQALETLANSPSLLTTLVDANGMYDQPRLMSLVQTLSASKGGASVPTVSSAYGSSQPSYQASTGVYGTSPSAPSYSQSVPFSGSSIRNGHRGSSEGNLHVSGYGPATTQADIITLFSPYVQVDEVVMKGTFAFVNTSDPINAQRAREALNGSLLGGMPVRINPAQRKSRDTAPGFGGAAVTPSYGGTTMSSYGAPPAPSTYGAGPAGSSVPGSSFMGGSAPGGPTVPQHAAPPMSVPGGSMPQSNVDSIRDDRGNPATKNLFVAGYGPGTTEQQLRELFSQYVTVIGVVLKGTFSFVNTSDREMAVRAREMLSGTMLNGGPMRINFAKETGRLGTSFDITYNATSGPNAPRSAPPANLSYYGRGF